MSTNIFDVPDALVAHVAQATAYGSNTQTANLLLGMARPAVPPANATLNQAHIDLIMVAIDKHFDTALHFARQWESANPLLETAALKDQFVNVLQGFARFARHMDVEYRHLIELAYAADEAGVADKLHRVKNLLEILLAENKGTATSVANYQTGLANALAAFQADFQNVLAEVDTVSSVISSLKSKISSLQDEIAENNAAVLQTFLDTADTEIEQGVTLTGAAAEENAGDAVSAGVQMGIAYVDGLVKTIELNNKTLDDLLTIRELGKQVGQDEVILVVLMNIGTMLASLGATQGLRMDIVGDVLDYWSQLDDHIGSLLQQHAGNLAAQIDLSNFSPATEDEQNPAFPPWNVLRPLERAARVFTAVLNMKAVVFDDNTRFAALGSSAQG